MANIIKKLVLNNNYREQDDRSLVNAENVRLSKDNAALISDYNITNSYLDEWIKAYYGIHKHTVAGHIDCPDEVVLFIDTGINTDILRYNYKDDPYKVRSISKTQSQYFKESKFIGTYTYNYKKQLLIAFSELREGEKIPLRTINLGKYKETASDDNDIEANDRTLSLVPEIDYPVISNISYVNELVETGLYTVYFRYKINKNDYTQWYRLTSDILSASVEENNIQKIVLNKIIEDKDKNKTRTDYCLKGCSTYTKSKNNYNAIQLTYKVESSGLNYKYIQFAYVCNNVDKSICYRTNDISLIYDEPQNIVISGKLFTKEYAVNELNRKYYNYYNVKNIINNNNRIYISNYEEDKTDEQLKDIVKECVSVNIKTRQSNFNSLNDYYTDVVSKNSALQLYYSAGIDKSSKCLGDFLGNESVHIFKKGNDTNRLLFNLHSRIGKEYGWLYGAKIYERSTDNKWRLRLYTKDNKLGIVEQDFNQVKNTNNPDYQVKITNLDVIWNAEDNFGNHFDITVDVELHHSTLGKINTYRTRIYYIDDAKFTLQIDEDKRGGIFEHIYYGNVSANKVYIGKDKNTGEEYFYIIENDIETKVRVSYEENFIFPEDFTDTSGSTFSYKFINNKNSLTTRLLGDSLDPGQEYNFFIHFVDKYGRITEGYNIGKAIADISLYPHLDTSEKIIFPIYYPEVTFNRKILDIQDYYKGYIISYEKIEKKLCVSGIVKYEENEIKVISDYLEISDIINVNFNSFSIYETSIKDNYNVTSEENLKYLFKNRTPINHDYNVILTKLINDDGIEKTNVDPIYTGTVTDLTVIAPDDYSKVNANREACIKFTPKLEDDDEFVTLDNGKYYIIEFFNTSEKYKNEIKNLIQIGYGFNTFPTFYVGQTILKGKKSIYYCLGCYRTYNNVIHYEKNGVQFISTDTTIRDNDDKYFINNIGDSYIEYRPFYCITFPVYDTYLHELKEITNKPDNELFIVAEATTNDMATHKQGVFTDAKDLIDLYNYNIQIPNNNESQHLLNYDKRNTKIYEFNKTIRRSDVMQDESAQNAWRMFNVENYKIIKENKGIITNIKNVNHYMIIHTQHSMFVLTDNDILSADGKAIQLEQHDIFDVNYKEVVSLETGYTGLVKNTHAIVGQFGYIFYDADDKRLYKFELGQLKAIDVDIVNIEKPDDVIFADDKKNDRLFIKLGDTVLSYHYGTNNFISKHDFTFTDAIHNKTDLLLINNDNILTFSKTSCAECSVEILVNTNYDTEKTIEYISYVSNSCNNDEKEEIPLTPYNTRISNHLCDTDDLNTQIIIPKEEWNRNINRYPLHINYKKPYFELGKWNFSYIRNDDKFKSKLFGNYFIIKLQFESINDNFIKIKSLDAQLTKY